jgi:TRAP-type uncharacterized transport system fused permease subunit
MVRADMDEALAHDVIKLMFDHKAELAAIHPSAKKLELETAQTVVAPIRPDPALPRRWARRPPATGGRAVSTATEVQDVIEEFESERPGRKLHGFPRTLVAVFGAGLSVFAIAWVFNPIAAQVYRPAFLTIALFLTFLSFRATRQGDERDPSPADWVVGVAAVIAVGYAVVTADDLVRRAARPETLDLVFGVATIALALEATRRTTGAILPGICLGFLAYAYFGGLTYIVLFAIYGAVLEYSGGARFFVELSFAAFGRSRTGPGRTSALAGFLLGTVSNGMT